MARVIQSQPPAPYRFEDVAETHELAHVAP